MKQESIRFGIICESETFPLWQANAIRQLLELDYVTCELLIKGGVEDQTFREVGFNRYKFKNLFWHIYLYLFRNKFNAHQKVHLNNQLHDAECIHCEMQKEDKSSWFFKKTDVEKIKDHNLDFILWFGDGTIGGEILNSTNYGVWSFHHDDEQKYRGGPPCFWEIYNNDGIIGASLQKVTGKLDAGVVLKKGYLKTRHSYVENYDQLSIESSRWPAQLCVDIKNENTEKFFAAPSKTSAQIYSVPTNVEFLAFMYQSLLNRLKERMFIFLYVDYWNIGIAEAKISDFLDNEKKPNVKWFPLETKDEFVADPFAIPDLNEKDKLHVFYETYPFKKNKGRIDYASYNGQFSLNSQIVLDKSFHLSYPYILFHEGSYYMVPESFGDNTVSIYRATNFPLQWEKHGILIDNFKGIDTTLIKHQGMWWLFTSDKNDGHHYNLKLFYSENLFSGWKPHPKNPVKTDITSARCAGTPFVYKGDLIRPSMDYSEKIEGRIILNKVLSLSITDYEEVSIKTIEPYKKSSFPDKIHTLSSAGNYTIVDGCKEFFIFNDFNFLKSKAKLLVQKVMA